MLTGNIGRGLRQVLSPRELLKDIHVRGLEHILMAQDSDSNMALFSAHLFLIMPDSASAS